MLDRIHGKRLTMATPEVVEFPIDRNDLRYKAGYVDGVAEAHAILVAEAQTPLALRTAEKVRALFRKVNPDAR